MLFYTFNYSVMSVLYPGVLYAAYIGYIFIIEVLSTSVGKFKKNSVS